MLEFARALADAEGLQDIYERIAEHTAAALEVPEAALWLQDPGTGEVCAEAVCGLEGRLRDRALSLRYSRETAESFVDLPGPFVYRPEDHPDVPSVHDPSDGFRFGIAAFRFDGGRMGFLIAGAPSDVTEFDDLALEVLAGLADQAKLAITSAR